MNKLWPLVLASCYDSFEVGAKNMAMALRKTCSVKKGHLGGKGLGKDGRSRL